jgi:transposase
MDNASIHRSREALHFYVSVKMPVMFLAPYSFEMAAVERLFSFIKNRDLNPLSAIKYSR